MWSRRRFLVSSTGIGISNLFSVSTIAAGAATGADDGTVPPARVAYRIIPKDRYPYPPALLKRLHGRTFSTPGEAIRAFGKRHHPFLLMPVMISQAKENPVQIRLNVGAKSQLPSQK